MSYSQHFQEVQKVEFQSVPNSLELSRDGAILTVAHGTFCFVSKITFLYKFKKKI